MRHAATLVVGFGLVALCIYTAVLRGKIWLLDAEIEYHVREETRLGEAIRNTRARASSAASVVQLVEPEVSEGTSTEGGEGSEEDTEAPNASVALAGAER